MSQHHDKRITQSTIEFETVFGKLTVIERIEQRRHSHWFYRCRCSCGTETIVSGCHLLSSHTQSCGCHRTARISETKYRHGASNTRIHGIWTHMIARCENPSDKRYADYGGRGITVFSEWREASNFIQWARHHGYREHLLIERIDNDGPYSPENCRWADVEDQANNKRNNVRLTAFGETKTLAQWTRDSRCRVNYARLHERVQIFKWPAERCLTEEPRLGRGSHFVTIFGESKSLADWAKDHRCVVPYMQLHRRIHQMKWDAEIALTTPLQSRKRKAAEK